MNKNIIYANVLFYAVLFLLVGFGKSDASSSLGYGFFIIIFLALSMTALIFLLVKKIIRPRTFADKLGIFTVTPVVPFLIFWLLFYNSESPVSEYFFQKGEKKYKVEIYNYKNTSYAKRVIFYKERIDNTGKKSWVKDSFDIHLSKDGDTMSRRKYRNGVVVTE